MKKDWRTITFFVIATVAMAFAFATCSVDDLLADSSENGGNVSQGNGTSTDQGGSGDCSAGTAEHTWDTGKITLAATENDDGEKTYTCTVCGKTKTEAIPALGHEHTVASEWTSDETFHWHEASCEKEAHRTDKAAHNWDEGETTKAATENDDGEKTYTCTVCGRTKTEAIPALGHEHTVASEWTSDETFHWHEASCGREEHRTSKTAHEWDIGTVTTAPTCTETGETTYTCTTCGKTRTEAIAANGHSYSTTWKSDANGHWNECAICGKKGNFAEHATMTVTLTSDGKRKEICATCGYGTTSSAWTKETLSELSEALKNYEPENATVKVVGELTDTTAISAALLEFRKPYYPYAPSKQITLDLSETTGLTTILFENCSSLAGILLPSNVTEIGDRAFYYCQYLKSITIPETVTRIGKEAFYYCESLTSITIPNSVTQIGNWVFAGCFKIASVTFPNGITEIVDGMLSCTALTNITIPKTVTRIGAYAFEGCDSLTSITIPNSVTEIGSRAFCKSTIEEITIPNSVTEIEDSMFESCHNLKSITIPNSVTKIGERAFFGCRSPSVRLPSSITEIGEYAFAYSKLEDIELSTALTKIAAFTFYKCEFLKLKTMKIPASVTLIEYRAFEDCLYLGGVEFEDPSGWYVTYEDKEHEIYPEDSPSANATRLRNPEDWTKTDRYGVKWINDLYKK